MRDSCLGRCDKDMKHSVILSQHSEHSEHSEHVSILARRIKAVLKSDADFFAQLGAVSSVIGKGSGL